MTTARTRKPNPFRIAAWAATALVLLHGCKSIEEAIEPNAEPSITSNEIRLTPRSATEPSYRPESRGGPTVAVRNAPYGSTIYIDGAEIGPAAVFDGKDYAIGVETGAHEIEIKTAEGKTIIKKTVFFEIDTHQVFLIRDPN